MLNNSNLCDLTYINYTLHVIVNGFTFYCIIIIKSHWFLDVVAKKKSVGPKLSRQKKIKLKENPSPTENTY